MFFLQNCQFFGRACLSVLTQPVDEGVERLGVVDGDGRNLPAVL